MCCLVDTSDARENSPPSNFDALFDNTPDPAQCLQGSGASRVAASGERKDRAAPRVRPVPISRCRYSPLEAGPAGFPFPNIIASWMPPTPGGGYEPSRPICAPFVTSSGLLRPHGHGRSRWRPARSRHLVASEVSHIRLQRPSLLAPERLRGNARPDNQDSADRLRSSYLYHVTQYWFVTHL